MDPVAIPTQTTWRQAAGIVRGILCWAWDTVQIWVHVKKGRRWDTRARRHHLAGAKDEGAGPRIQAKYNHYEQANDDQVNNRLQLDRHHLLSTKFFFRLR